MSDVLQYLNCIILTAFLQYADVNPQLLLHNLDKEKYSDIPCCIDTLLKGWLGVPMKGRSIFHYFPTNIKFPEAQGSHGTTHFTTI